MRKAEKAIHPGRLILILISPHFIAFCNGDMKLPCSKIIRSLASPLERQPVVLLRIDVIDKFPQPIGTVVHFVVIPSVFKLILRQETHQKCLSDIGMQIRAVTGDVETDEELAEKEVGRHYPLNQIVPCDPVYNHHR